LGAAEQGLQFWEGVYPPSLLPERQLGSLRPTQECHLHDFTRLTVTYPIVKVPATVLAKVQA